MTSKGYDMAMIQRIAEQALEISNKNREELGEVRDIAVSAKHDITTHEAVCAERYNSIRTAQAATNSGLSHVNAGLAGINQKILWGGASLIGILITVIGFLLTGYVLP